jgi:hypothetical protein
MANYGFTVNADGNVLEMTKKIETALSSMGVKAEVEVKHAENAFTKLHEKAKETFGGIKSLLLGGLGIGAIFEFVEFVKSSKEAFDSFEESSAKLNAALTSTKMAAGRSEEELMKGAKALSSQSLFSRSAIIDAQSMLLTFTSIRGEIFDKTMPAIANFATRFKMDLPAAANALGKALNDPEKGMTRLQRQGVVFSDAQKEVIKHFVETGQKAKAQQVILKELETEFGGLAKAMTQTDEGKIAMAKKQWGAIKLEIGEIISKLQVSLIPVLTAVINAVKGVGHMFTSSSTGAIIFRDGLMGIAAALAIYYGYLGIVSVWEGIVTVGQWAWNAAMQANPIVWIIDLIVLLIIGIAALWDKVEGFRKFLGGAWAAIKQGVMSLVHVFMNVGQVIWDVLTGNFKKALTDGKAAIKQFGEDMTTGMVNAVKKGADAAGKSTFKFSNLLKFGTGQEGPSKGFGGAEGHGGRGGGGAVGDNAVNTSQLSGAKGGLGEAKVINIHIDTMQKVTTLDNRDLKSRGQDAVEVMLRALNNIAYSQSSSQ